MFVNMISVDILYNCCNSCYQNGSKKAKEEKVKKAITTEKNGVKEKTETDNFRSVLVLKRLRPNEPEVVLSGIWTPPRRERTSETPDVFMEGDSPPKQ